MADEYYEPGFNLTSLRVADKNAKAAIEISRLARKESSDARQRITQLEAEVAAMKVALEQLRQQMFTMVAIGTGPTQRN